MTAQEPEGYVLSTFDGNTGSTEIFDTLEDAVREMDYRWSHLTDRERIARIENGWHDVYFGKEDDDSWTAIESRTEEIRLVIETPKGPRYIQAFDLEDVWTSLRYYDRCHHTSLYSDLEMEDVLFDTPADGIEPFDRSDMEARIDDWSGTVRVTTTGNSVILKITDAARAMGLERGDYVDVTIRRKP